MMDIDASVVDIDLLTQYASTRITKYALPILIYHGYYRTILLSSLSARMYIQWLAGWLVGLSVCQST